MKKTLLFTSIIASSLLIASASEIGNIPFLRNINVTAKGDSSLTRLLLDDQILAKSANDLHDLRLQNDNGQDVPYVVNVTRYYDTSMVGANITDQVVNSQGQTMFIVDFGKEVKPKSSFKLFTNLSKYQRNVKVYTSDTLLPVSSNSWNLAVSDGYIYRYNDTKAGWQAEGNNINMPVTYSRYAKVVIDAGVEGAINVSSVQTNSFAQKEEAEVKEKSVNGEISQNANEKSTEIIFDLGYENATSNSVTLKTDDTKNFIRHAVVQSSNDKTSWSRIGEGSVSAISTSLYNGKQLNITYRETKAQYLRVIIFNYDDAPITWNTEAKIGSAIKSIIYEGDAKVLYYGNSSVSYPQYDLASRLGYINFTGMGKAGTGTEIKNDKYIASEPAKKPFTTEYPFVIPIILGFFVVIVAGLAYFQFRNLNKHETTTPTV